MMELKYMEIITIFVLNLLHHTYADYILSCNPTSYPACPGVHEFCNATTATCDCDEGFVRLAEDCKAPGDDAGSSHSATVVLISIFTVALILCGLLLVVRKYNLIEYVRQKINLRRNNDVMYEDVMIGNDDPPLSP